MEQAIIKATVILEKSLWVVLFERTAKQGYAVVRWVFGEERISNDIARIYQRNKL